MPKPKFVKPLLIGCACALPVGLIVGLSVNWQHRQFLSAVGSSGAKPFIEAFGNAYHNENEKIDVAVESGGTIFAIEELSNGLTNVGNTSINPYPFIKNIQDGSYLYNWDNKKTFTLGYEGVVIMYHMPEGLSQKAKDAFDIIISQNNILQLYAVFSGFNELKDQEWKDEYGSMWFFMTDAAKAACNSSDKAICQNTQIIPYVRSGGNTAANSSIAFTYYSNLVDYLTSVTTNQFNAFAGGQYGTDRQCHETEEANSRAWELFNKDDLPGSMVYLTTGFVIPDGNQQMIKDAGYRFAKYLPKDATEPVSIQNKADLEKICVANGYNWYRPINCMIDLDDDKSKDFIYWIYANDSYTKIMNEKGAKQLTLEQFKSMCYKNEASKQAMFSPLVSDIKLEAERHGTLFAEVYGACDLW